LLVGERVVAGLADVLLEGGRPAAEAALANAQLSEALAAALDGPQPPARRTAHEAALRDRDGALDERLTALRAVAADAAPTADTRGALPVPADLAGLAPEEARAATLAALAERSYEAGPSALGAALADPLARARVDRADWTFEATSADAHGRYRLWSGVFGVVGVLLLAIAALAATGYARAWVPGLAIAAAGAPLWAFAAAVLPAAATADAAAPADVAAIGAPAGVAAWGAWLAERLGAVVGEAVAFVPLVVAAAGAGLVVGTALIALIGWLRPRRRRY
jgi:hypothetical protein